MGLTGVWWGLVFGNVLGSLMTFGWVYIYVRKLQAHVPEKLSVAHGVIDFENGKITNSTTSPTYSFSFRSLLPLLSFTRFQTYKHLLLMSCFFSVSQMLDSGTSQFIGILTPLHRSLFCKVDDHAQWIPSKEKVKNLPK
jgi:hypothetical protein